MPQWSMQSVLRGSYDAMVGSRRRSDVLPRTVDGNSALAGSQDPLRPRDGSSRGQTGRGTATGRARSGQRTETREEGPDKTEVARPARAEAIAPLLPGDVRTRGELLLHRGLLLVGHFDDERGCRSICVLGGSGATGDNECLRDERSRRMRWGESGDVFGRLGSQNEGRTDDCSGKGAEGSEANRRKGCPR